MLPVSDVIGLIRSSSGRRRLRQAVRARLFSQCMAVGLCRILDVPFEAPLAKLAVDVRPLRPNDDLSFLAVVPGLAPDLARGRLDQSRLVAANIPTCWIAADPSGSVCYMQWLITARDNGRIRDRWGALFPTLEPDEALLEGAYTAETHRGQGIMSHAMARIAQEATKLGAHRVITFVHHENIASLKGCEKAGFAPYIERREAWALFRQRVRFLPLNGTPPRN